MNSKQIKEAIEMATDQVETMLERKQAFITSTFNHREHAEVNIKITFSTKADKVVVSSSFASADKEKDKQRGELDNPAQTQMPLGDRKKKRPGKTRNGRVGTEVET